MFARAVCRIRSSLLHHQRLPMSGAPINHNPSLRLRAGFVIAPLRRLAPAMLSIAGVSLACSCRHSLLRRATPPLFPCRLAYTHTFLTNTVKGWTERL